MRKGTGWSLENPTVTITSRCPICLRIVRPRGGNPACCQDHADEWADRVYEAAEGCQNVNDVCREAKRGRLEWDFAHWLQGVKPAGGNL